MEEQQKSKNQILYLLKMRGPQTATVLAEQLQVSPMAIRQHLQALQADRWVTYQEERRPQGRPVKLWQLTDRSTTHFPDSHADLMLDLLRGVEAVFGTPGLEKLLAERTQRQMQTYAACLSEFPQAKDWRGKVAAIACLRNREGYMAEAIDQPDGSMLLVENHCPIRTAAASCQLLCRCELEVFKALLGKQVSIERVEHSLQGDRRCAYLIRD
ncbi:helix-turn-helix transcriptional regulator [Aerosakkonema funiforme]|uniref:Transcriptional regulator n=1 Tax=Aerosakkonema funiforme FACHB-1375 TaxID=2949571 RepID=A0A926VHH6_9CYAN|nr:metalloregulator ArsR/SmtB family transcription factor [Aerosakkonema funiforme]MBD2184091.1 transcriptional regulator [Aerosakkonema funiforme FACHB-1375]